ncbi:MAG: ABC transporter permease [Lachnospiraceae bacterium]|nr:ABC transporter permease [Lachnospiraceae bacterium]
MWSRFKRSRGAMAGLFCIALLSLFALIGPALSPYTYDEVSLSSQYLPPGAPSEEYPGHLHFWGTDELGRDLWTRVWMGTRISLYVALLSVLIDLTIGILYGVTAGYYGGAVDLILQRILEVIQGIPTIVIVTLLMLVLKPGLVSITVALVFAGWINLSLLVRAQVLKLKETEYVLASKTLGASDLSIIIRDILPNAAGQIVIMAMMSVPGAIFLEAYLSFLGLGIPDPMASLGSLINSGFKSMLLYPWLVLIPVIIFVLLVVSFNLAADGLRDALDVTLGTSEDR